MMKMRVCGWKEITNDMIRDESMINKTHRIMISNHSHHFSSTGTTSNTVDEGHCKGGSEDTMELKVRRKERDDETTSKPEMQTDQ